MRLVVGSCIGPYEIMALLGAGGMGEVYRARDSRLNRDVAIKVLPADVAQNPGALNRFERETKAIAALSHPNILSIYDIGKDKDISYAVTELLEGETLRARLTRAPLPPEKAIENAIAIAEGLSGAHSKGVIHRDLKPENIFLTSDGRLKILDFGLAKLIEPDTNLEQITTAPPRTATATEPGVLFGTIPYMSPEHIQGQSVDQRSDIFSLGSILYEMLTGKRAFSKESNVKSMYAILYEEPNYPTSQKNVTPEIMTLLKRCMEKNPQQRFQSAQDLAFALKQLLSEPGFRAFDGARSKVDRAFAEPRVAPILNEAVDARLQLTLKKKTGLLLHGISSRLMPPITPRVKKLAWLVSATFVATALLLFLAIQIPSMRHKTQNLENVESVLALPCTVYGSPEVNYLTDAIPSSLSTLLARVPGLETRISPTSFEVDRLHGDLNKVADAYDISTFVMSSISKESNKLILNVQIVGAANKKVLWSNQYEGTLQNYTELAREAADGIRKALRPSSPSISVASVAGFAANSEAELAFHRGKFHSNRFDSFRKSQDFDEASNAFQRALALDPDLSDAAAEIGYLYYLKFEISRKGSDLAAVESWARKALAIDSNCAVGWMDLSLIELANPIVDPKKLLAPALKAATLGPNAATTHQTLSLALASFSVSLSVKAAEVTHRLDPLYPYAAVSFMDPLIISGRYKEAMSIVEDLLRMEPDLPILLFYKSLILSNLGQVSESEAILKQLEPVVKENRFHLNLFLIAKHVNALQSKKYVEADKINKELTENINPATVLFRAVFVAPLLVRHGRQDQALQILNRSLEVNILPHDFLLMSPEIRALKEDARFKKVFAESLLRFQTVLAILDESKQRGEFPDYLEQPLNDLLNQIQSTST